MSSGQNLISFTLLGALEPKNQFKNELVSFWNIALCLIGLVFFCSANAFSLEPSQKTYRKPAQAAAQSPAVPSPQPEKPVSSSKPPSLEKMEAEVAAHPKNVGLVINLAQEYFNRGEYDLCTRLLWKSIDKLDRKAMILLAKAHIKKKEFPEVIRISQILISKNEKDEEAHTLMGQAHLMAGREKDALSSFKKATEINGIYQPAYEGLISVYQKRDNLYELRIIYQDMIEKLGERSEFLTRLCEINTKDALNDHALEYCRKAIQKADQIPENHVNLGLIYKNQGELKKAQEKLKFAADKFPQSTFAQITYAKFVEEKSDFIEAFRSYSNCLKIETENEICLLGHGFSGAQIEKMEESFQSLKKACFKNRKNAVTVRKIVQLLKTSKKKDWLQRFESLAEKCMLQ